MFNTASIVTLLVLTVWSNECLCDICKVCECVNTDSGLVARCRGKFVDESFNYEFITMNERQPLYKLVLTENLGAVLSTSQIRKKMKYLKQLDLSGNQLENVHAVIFQDLHNLEDLSYSDNRLSSFDISILNTNSALLRLNLSHNEINRLERSSYCTLPSLKVLDLSHNNLTDFRDFLDAVPRLEHLDLSSNSLSNLEASLAYMEFLKSLRISDNFLLSLNFVHLPLRLKELHAKGNLISVLEAPKKILIHVLNLENNRIIDLTGEEFTLLEELRHLNVRGNSLSGFPPVTLKHIKSLDLSFNNLTTIPESISTTYFPALKVLKVSGNRLEDLILQSELKLEAFEASHMDTIEEIREDTFGRLSPRENGCINVTISNCSKLRAIAEDAFRYMNVCSLDLSNNRFAHFPSRLISDSRNKNPNYLVNLQGNPLVCNCSLQWMLDELVPYLYKTQPRLLEELRCAGPPVFAKLRLAHWYRWQNKEFCSALSERMIINVAGVSSRQKTTFNSSSGMLIALGVTATIFAILMMIGIMLTRKVVLKKRRVNRRF
ncbi:PREDICTED: leucine-rich repeats and immunoglobulin-like domains protein 1 [Dinoponera quadriceps]|uniref:Leucine-rich repeats and immunoglobulin-like domains protein 1 n=1 Tax=Dinoponera quadriceps TaxID=609295 RepID=A0A6P3Y927_DINQU|nr:PREDICTED: leucine-rich repeats and immunoglobulin-like domains protein 1 [Dinoponera quadriceps]